MRKKAEATNVACPVCGAEEGRRCVDLGAIPLPRKERRKALKRMTRDPHAARLALASQQPKRSR
ncbi:MAG: hypothetical protein GC206_13355 [Alphaproteobacteria bacterium]|nr:hypothetical protein [Alphaproteobacteria bacterium]